VASLVGIWPRFIEPYCLSVTQVAVALERWPSALDGFKVVQFSDLHLHSGVPDSFLHKLTGKILDQDPDIILFTGDFLCRAALDDGPRLAQFLQTLHAPYGCYAVLGNHDYAQGMSINRQGDYDLLEEDCRPYIVQGFERLVETPQLSRKVTARARQLPPHSGLVELLKSTPFRLLHNETVQISLRGESFNLVGCGEYSLGRTIPSEAFAHYHNSLPGIVMLHNPDGLSLLQGTPGDLVLCGHTHGGQVNLPWLWRKFTPMENCAFKKGWCRDGQRRVYVNRGVGSMIPFRWFAMPELLSLTMEGSA
jgi:hypothetical protein